MFRSLIFSGLLVVFGFLSLASAQNPISYWDLNHTANGTAVDSINGNNGVWQNGANTNLGQVSGFVGGGADLNDAGGNGANNFFQINSVPELIGGDGVTLSAWIQPQTQASSGYNGILMTRTFNGQTNNSWGLAYEGSHLDSRVDNNGIDSPDIIGANSGWYHVALSYDATTKTHTQYVNGVQTNTQSVAGDGGLGPVINGPTSGPWFIGYDNCCGNSRDFDGGIDEVAAWNTSLTAADIQKVYTAGLNNQTVSQALATPTPHTGIQDGLIGSWNMDQHQGTNAAGDSINGNNAILTNMNNNAAWVTGQVGRALDFDGSNDEAIISGISQLDGASELTLSTWVRSEGNNNNEGILQHRSPGNANLTGLNFPNGGASDDIQARINSQSLNGPAGSAPNNTWSHIVQTYKEGEFHRIYVDGVMVSENAGNFGNIISDGAWRFGNDTCCGNRFFNGQIDDTGVWSRALGQEEINAIRAAGLNSISHTRAFIPEDGAIQRDLVGHWTFDQARFSDTAHDSFGSAGAGLSNMDSSNAWVNGQIGGALQFDGSNDQAVISGSAATQLNTELNGSNALTMSLWVRSDGPNNNNEGLFEHRSGNNNNLTGLNTPSVGTNNFDFRLNGTALRSDDNTLSTTGEWQHIVGVWEADNRYEIWIDGVLEEIGTAPSGPLVADGDWRFGNDTCCGNRFFDGAIDDAGLWNVALTPEEIRAVYQAGLESLNIQQATIPEPASVLIWGVLGAVGFVWRRRRRLHSR